MRGPKSLEGFIEHPVLPPNEIITQATNNPISIPWLSFESLLLTLLIPRMQNTSRKVQINSVKKFVICFRLN